MSIMLQKAMQRQYVEYAYFIYLACVFSCLKNDQRKAR